MAVWQASKLFLMLFRIARAPARPLVLSMVARIVAWSVVGTPASGMSVCSYTCDRRTPATVSLTPWKMATLLPSVPT